MTKKIKKEFIQSPKGMHDMLYGDIKYLDKILEKAQEISQFYGFLPIQTPHLEHAELFSRPLGETSEVVEKQMYTLKTNGGDLLALRPEGTAPVMRAYQQNGMGSWPQPVKLSYYGSFFRHENPQKGRFREFRQFGMEVLGESDSIIDALVIKVFYLILSGVGFKNVMVHINSIGDKDCRPGYKKELANYYKKKFNYLCKDCKRRLKENPLRLLDCKEPGCIEIKAQAPQMIDHLCEGCKDHFKGVLEYLDEGQIPYVLDNYLVRGFDYYGRTVFEIFLEENAKEKSAEPQSEDKNNEPAQSIALGGGGRYDDLMTILGGKSLPAAGAAFGLERIIYEMKRLNIPPKAAPEPKVFLIQIGPAAKKRSFTLMEELRDKDINVAESLSRDNFRAQLKIAAKVGAKFSLILGQKEAMDGSVIVRDMDEGTQEIVLQDKLIEKLKIKLKAKK